MDDLAENRAKAAWAALLFGVVSLVGLFAAFAAVKDFAYARASGKWTQTGGVVLSEDGDGFRYAYHWDGESREGRRVSFFTRGYIGAPPPKTPGARVAVYVSPSDPNTSVLVPGGSGRRFAVWIAISGFIVFMGVAGVTRTMLAFDFPEYGLSPRQREDLAQADERAPAPAEAYSAGEDPRFLFRGSATVNSSVYDNLQETLQRR